MGRDGEGAALDGAGNEEEVHAGQEKRGLNMQKIPCAPEQGNILTRNFTLNTGRLGRAAECLKYSILTDSATLFEPVTLD